MATRFLNNIRVNDAYTFPTSDGDANQVITTDGSGTLSFSDPTTLSMTLTVKNVSGGTLSKGTVVHAAPTASPPSGNVIEVIAADYDTAASMPAIGILNEQLTDESEGEAIMFGRISGIDTSSFSAGDEVYVGNAGALTATKPTGTKYIQKMGVIIKSHASNGSLEVFGAGRTNDVPTPLYIDHTNQRLGIGATSPAVALDVNSTDAIAFPTGTTAQRPGSPAAGMLRYNTTDGQFEGYTTEWGAIAGSGGGGGGSSSFYKDTFSGDGTTTGFTLANSVANENLTQIYISGVYQSKDNYSVNGTGITFTTAPPTGTNNIEVISVGSVTVSDEGTLSKDSFTGDGSTTQFTLSAAPTSEDMTYVFIQGVYQEKSTYSLSGSTLTFTEAPQNGYTFEVMSLTAVNLSQTTYLANDTFTGTGSQTSFTLVNGTPTNKAFTMVFLSGVYQQKSTYSLTSGAIVFGTAPASNDTIEIVSIGNGGLVGTSINDANNAKYNVNVINNSTTASAGSVYVFTANLNLTLPASPSSGDSIKIANQSNVATCQLLRNGNRILGVAEDLTLDTVGASFELIYSDATNGWVIIGQ